MMVFLREDAGLQRTTDDWTLPAEPPFVRSSAFGLLTRDLRRYLQGQIYGRSYLIAGHRGVGKTALVLRATQELGSALVRESVKDNAVLPPGPLQRPLLVKLHGPSMLAAEPSKSAADSGDPAQNALVQITIGLYRALAAEATQGATAHARRLSRDRPGDFDERAAQLALDLDAAADPAKLRQAWQTMGRLKQGLFWPQRADATLRHHDMVDQGFREILALATTAQAFQVCSGRVTYSATEKKTNEQSQSQETKADGSGKELAKSLAPLSLGLLTALGVASSVGGADAVQMGAAGGLAAWLLGSISLTWGSKRSRAGAQGVDYSFIRDASPASLDRDLPLVITRLREASLAPVFIVDELDKVEDAPEAVTTLVSRLKHLIVDFGFFCFLVNRDCYEEIEHKLQLTAYPPEHTLFSERVLLRPEPDYLLLYLMERTSCERDVSGPLARAVFALLVMHRGALNLTEVIRQVGRMVRGDDGSIRDSSELVSPRNLVVASVQLAIAEVLRAPAMAERMETDASFAQLAIDMAYFPSREWISGKSRLDPSREALKRYLEARMDSASLSSDACRVAPEDLDLLHEHLILHVRNLQNFAALRQTIADQTVVGLLLRNVIPEDVVGIIEESPVGAFRFTYLPSGEPRIERPNVMTEQMRDDAQTVLSFAVAIQNVLNENGIDIDELAKTSLTATFSSDVLKGAMAGVEAALITGWMSADFEQYRSTLNRFRIVVQREDDKIGASIALVAALRRDTEDSSGLLSRITRLVRFDRDPSSWLSDLSISVKPLPQNAGKVAAWGADLKTAVAPPADAKGSPADAYLRLRKPIQGFLETPERAIYVPTYHELRGAALQRIPFSAFGWDLARLTNADWSALALAAMPAVGQTRATAPYWLLVAALRALGFGRPHLAGLADRGLANSLVQTGWWLADEGLDLDQSFELANQFAFSGAERPPGILVIDTEDGRYGAGLPYERRAVLVVPPRSFEAILGPLQWLDAMGIFAGTVDARPAPAEA